MADRDDDLLDEQLRYYGTRAPHYDDAYTRTGHSDRGPEANAAWFAELAVVERAVDDVDLTDRDVLELGCGTGHWTRRLATRARRVLAVDGSSEMLDVARDKLRAAGATNVDLLEADIIRTWEPEPDATDVVAAFFFLEHVPDEVLDSVVAKMASALRPGGQLLVAEGHRREAMPDIEHRHLHDVEYRVVERRRTAEEFAAAFAAHGISVDVTHTEQRFCIVRGALTG